MNIYDVSKKADVSIATVSRVLNGNPNVSDKTRARVLSVMEELGYEPNVFARGLGLGTIRSIGIMCSDSSDPYLANAIYYLERELRANGYDSLLCCTGSSLETKRQYFQLLRSKKVDAIILVGSKFIEMNNEDNSYIIKASKSIPIMLVNGYLKGDNIYCTLCDDQTAAAQATSHLIDTGCHDILYLYSSYSFSGLNKQNGYKLALEAHGLPIRESYIHKCEKNVLRAQELITQLHNEGLSFDAILTSDDTLAVGAVKFAHAAGIRIPEDLSIIGYNDSNYAVCTDPELTSIDSRVETLCTCTIRTLMDVFQGNQAANKTIIAAKLVKRGTVRA